MLRLGPTLGLAVLLAACFPISPTQSVLLPFVVAGAKIRWEVWSDRLDDGRYVLAVTTRYGTKRIAMWEDWGPAQRAIFYKTEDVLIVIGDGNEAAIQIPSFTPPAELPFAIVKRLDPNRWTYLGAVDGAPVVRFSPPRSAAECLPGWESLGILTKLARERGIAACPDRTTRQRDKGDDPSGDVGNDLPAN